MLRERYDILLVNYARTAQGWIVEGGNKGEGETTSTLSGLGFLCWLHSSINNM